MNFYLLALLLIAFINSLSEAFQHIHTRSRPFPLNLVEKFSDEEPEKVFCVNVNLAIKPQFREQFLRVIKNNELGTLQEPLALQYTWGESLSEKNLFHFQEQFKGDRGFEAHKKTSHFAAWMEFTSIQGSPFSRPAEIFTFYKF